jgi:meso-butanediol dehydrogenase/(S,S)-butanediol dehydrogenase/diacetyl reductase
MQQQFIVPERFAGKTAVVTGAAGGIGAATATRLAEEGANVLCCDVAAEVLESNVEAINASGGTAVAHVLDVSDPDACTAAIQAAVDTWGRLDALCNVAGILRWSHSHEETDQQWQMMININLSGVFYLSRAALPHLIETQGAILNVASTAGVIGQAYLSGYCASKHAVIGLTKAMAIEYAGRKVRVNAICPGNVDTPMTREIDFPEGADFDLVMRASLADRACKPADVAAMIAWAVSDEAFNVSGSIMSIDGGVAAG